MTLEQRQEVVKEAKSWIGTPYRVRGKIKGIGVDCAMILEAVYGDKGTKLVPGLKIDKYNYQHAQHKADHAYTKALLNHGAIPIYLHDVLPGDIAVYFAGMDYSHSAIIVQWPNEVIHASKNGVQLVHGLNEPSLQGKKIEFFTIK